MVPQNTPPVSGAQQRKQGSPSRRACPFCHSSGHFKAVSRPKSARLLWLEAKFSRLVAVPTPPDLQRLINLEKEDRAKELLWRRL